MNIKRPKYYVYSWFGEGENNEHGMRHTKKFWKRIIRKKWIRNMLKLDEKEELK
jgi:hypothetical protein